MLVVGNARIGVATFFVISGYLITYLLRRESEQRGRISLRGFYYRRILRIFPAFYSYLIVIALLAPLGVVTTGAYALLAAGTFTINYWTLMQHNPAATADGYWFVGHFWTLSLEEQFYLLWPLTLVLCGLYRARWVALTLIVVSPVIRLATYYFWPAARDGIDVMLFTNFDALMVGGAIALIRGEP